MGQSSSRFIHSPTIVLLLSVVAFTFGVIWVPWLSYNHVPERAVGWEAVDRARHLPEEDVLQEIGSYGLLEVFDWKGGNELVLAAEKIMAGRVELSGFPVGDVPRPHGPVEMASGPTMWQLFVHSLGLPRLLVEAYKVTGRPEFLRGAAEYLVAYDAYEGSEWTSPGGYLWYDGWRTFVRNDHAIAARALTLIEFWRVYRTSPELDANVAHAVLAMASRCAYLLSEPRRFTVATNHGVMQNLALCSLGLSFPTLPDAGGYCQLAFERLDEQLRFFINDEGFMLEHSPGYQSFSLRLIGIAFRLRSLSGQAIPESWNRKYQAAQRVYGALRRPDGSVPMFGDTDGGSQGPGPLVTAVDEDGAAGLLAQRSWAPDKANVLAPVAGYSLWWDGLEDWPNVLSLSQTSIAWSNFEGMGHKHADEPSLSIWASGIPWLDNVGYWSYDAVGRELAESWAGSNAPHFVDEPTISERETHLRYHGREGELAAIDVERVGPAEHRTRRQVIHVGRSIWIVIDTSAALRNRSVRTIWTTAPTVEVSGLGGEGEYRLTERVSDSSLRAYFSVDSVTTPRLLIGSESPFAGWRVFEGAIRKAPAFVVERPADSSWSIAAWSIEKPSAGGPALSGVPRMREWRSPDTWELMLPSDEGQILLTRREERLVWTSDSGFRGALRMEPGADVAGQRSELHSSLAASAARYGVPDMSGVYRFKVSVVLLLQVVASLAFVRRVRVQRGQWAIPASVVGAALWLLTSYYFVFIRTPLV